MLVPNVDAKFDVNSNMTANSHMPTIAKVETVALAKYTTLGVGGPAELWHVESLEDLKAATSEAYRVMGAGSNLLITDAGVPERVIRLGRSFNSSHEFDGRTELWLGAATPVPGLVRRATELGLTGLECMLGIPAVLGGAIAMNAGTRHGEIGEVLEAVELFVEGELQIVEPEALKLRYRHSELPKGAIITRAKLKLKEDSAEAIAERIEAVDAARKGQPKIKSAGCAFKNPEGDSAGRLIDAAGLKGYQVGGAMVSTEHGNFIVNVGNATAEDVIHLLREIRKKIETPLDVEWECWGIEDFGVEDFKDSSQSNALSQLEDDL